MLEHGLNKVLTELIRQPVMSLIWSVVTVDYLCFLCWFGTLSYHHIHCLHVSSVHPTHQVVVSSLSSLVCSLVVSLVTPVMYQKVFLQEPSWRTHSETAGLSPALVSLQPIWTTTCRLWGQSGLTHTAIAYSLTVESWNCQTVSAWYILYQASVPLC